MDVAINLIINGHEVEAMVDSRTTLLDFLRLHVGLTGTKKGCNHGQCGACTVLIDGRRMLSCLKFVAATSDMKVCTIEGIGDASHPHPVQTAFMKHDAFQCGFCTPGQIMSAVALLDEGGSYTREAIRERMSGNVCRCGAYSNIVSAIEEVLSQ